MVDLHCEIAQIGEGAQDGVLITYSVWGLELKEREHVAKGGNLKLGILYANLIPSVSLRIVYKGMPLT